MSRYFDCIYVGIDPQSGKHVVKEQLYSEARGWLEHEFNNQTEALRWLDDLKTETA